jgi:DNA-binding CsgD family transcriptional regulator
VGCSECSGTSPDPFSERNKNGIIATFLFKNCISAAPVASMSPPETDSLPLEDVRAIVRLLGEVIAAPGGHSEKKQLLMNGLCQIIDASAWIWGVGQHQPDKAPFYIAFDRGNIDENRFAKLMEAVNHPEMQEFARPFSEELATTGEHLTRLRQQINSSGTFIGSKAEQAWLRADIGPVMLSCKPLPDGGFSSIGIYRTGDRELFNEREAKIAHIVLTEVPWLHLQGWPDERGQSALTLFPRLRTVLNLLIEGWPRKQIADRLEISLHTVNDYVKDIYRHFEVHSQAELLAKLSRGNGGDLPNNSRSGGILPP